jgi:hypothetical protein
MNSMIIVVGGTADVSIAEHILRAKPKHVR